MKFHLKSANLLKLLFIIGLLITFVSLFLEWFFVELHNESGQLLLESTHEILKGWITIEYLESSFLDQYIPQNNIIPPMMCFIQVFLIVGSIVLALFRNPETTTKLETAKSNSYFYLSTTFMIILMIIVFPFMIIFPNDFYFPGMITDNAEFSITIYQEIGLGYIFQCVGFILTFPYSFFCYKIATTFEQQSKFPNKHFLLREVRESVNLDQLIAEEDAFLTSHVNAKKVKEQYGVEQQIENQIEIAYQQFQTHKNNNKRLKKH